MVSRLLDGAHLAKDSRRGPEVLHDAEAARSLAHLHLAPLGNLWAHVQATAQHAEEIAAVAGPLDRELLICAAWLHDIGHAPAAQRVGFHPVDGAVMLRELGWPERLAALVAHHCEARLIAAACGRSRQLSEFAHEESAVADALVYADLAAGHDGRRPSLRTRLDDLELIQPGDGPAMIQARAARRLPLIAAVHRTEQRLQGVHPALRSA